MDLLHSLFKWLDYNRFLAISLVTVAGIGFWVTGCNIKTQSLVDPNKQVTVQEFDREIPIVQRTMNGRRASIELQTIEYNADVDAYNAAIEVGNADIAAQQKMRSDLINLAGGVAQQIATGQPITAAGTVATLLQVLTMAGMGGVYLDNRRKDAKIKAQKTETPAA